MRESFGAKLQGMYQGLDQRAKRNKENDVSYGRDISKTSYNFDMAVYNDLDNLDRELGRLRDNQGLLTNNESYYLQGRIKALRDDLEQYAKTPDAKNKDYVERKLGQLKGIDTNDKLNAFVGKMLAHKIGSSLTFSARPSIAQTDPALLGILQKDLGSKNSLILMSMAPSPVEQKKEMNGPA